ncbi:MAG TPA: M56 family metallopeptidase [Mucilaginibacter sp.]|nr:M56 family metallopeptidase [Mucilaginibacter sp.]
MIDYLFKSALCLAILLAVYHLFLQNEKMHKFNRFFLLASLVLGLTIPLITLNVPNQPLPDITLPTIINNNYIADQLPAIAAHGQPNPTTQTISLFSVMLFIYCAGVLVLLARFINNLGRILAVVSHNPKIEIEQGVVVLLKEKVLPHTFLKYIFFNEEEYLSQNIDGELFTHEATHAVQKHSFDILLIEILQLIFWFNPVFILYKKAIQLNHEFLADEAVIQTCNNVSAYQQLLLSKMMFSQPVKLSSNLTYSLTKKRMTMMKKTTPKSRAMMKKLALTPLFAMLILLFSDKATALTNIKSSINHLVKKEVKAITHDSLKDGYYKDASIKYKDKNGNYIIKKYDEMTAEEKKNVPLPMFTPPGQKPPTEALLDAWKSSERYGIWVDGKQVANRDLSNYKASDFNFYWMSALQKGAQHYATRRFQIDLYSPAYYDAVYKKYDSKPGKMFVVFKTPNGRPYTQCVVSFESFSGKDIQALGGKE